MKNKQRVNAMNDRNLHGLREREEADGDFLFSSIFLVERDFAGNVTLATGLAANFFIFSGKKCF